jgi:EmrB/QacA subfamily drug resistance transporter
MMASQKQDKLDPQLIKTALILVVGVMAPMFDSTMLTIGIRAMTDDLSSTVSTIQWVITGYMLAMGVVVPVSGWAIARFGGKRTYLFSLGVFILGSLMSAVSWSIGSLLVFRVIQGAACGLMLPTLQTVLIRMAGSNKVGRVMAIVSLPALLGPILGPVLGSLIVGGLGWRWVFFLIDIPLATTGFLLSLWGVPDDSAGNTRQSLDIVGILLLSPAFALLIYGISLMRNQGGLTSPDVFAPLFIGIVLMLAFIIYGLHKKKDPVVDLRLFTSRNFSSTAISLFIAGFVTNGAMLLLPLYYQQVHHLDIFFVGLLMIPQGVGMLVTRSLAGRLTDRIGARPILLVSLVVTILGTLPFALIDEGTNQILLMGALLVRGAGLGGITIPLMASAYLGLSSDEVPHASIITRILQSIGAAFGTAIVATVIDTLLSSLDAADAVGEIDAYSAAFWCLIGLTSITIIPALFLPKKPHELV